MIDPLLVFLFLTKTLIFVSLDRIRVSLGITLTLSWHQGWWCLRWWCHALRPSQGTYCTCIQRREEKRREMLRVSWSFNSYGLKKHGGGGSYPPHPLPHLQPEVHPQLPPQQDIFWTPRSSLESSSSCGLRDGGDEELLFIAHPEESSVNLQSL